MSFESAMEHLLERACPSIQSRLRIEVLGQSPYDAPLPNLQPRILDDPLVQEVLDWQQPDGWFAWHFHGYPSTETAIRILAEKGVSPHHPSVLAGLNAIEMYPDRLNRGIGKPSKIADDMGLGGQALIRAAVFAYAGVESCPFVREQITQSLEAFRAVIGIGSIHEVAEPYKEHLVFRAGAHWPCIYHLRLLAYTKGWRTPENLHMLAQALDRLSALSPIPPIYIRHKSQLIAPASFAMQDFYPDLAALNPVGWMLWFHWMEMAARLGVVGCVPALQRQAATLRAMLDAEGFFTRPLSHTYFRQWNAYSGLMLERDWKSAQRRIYDLTFRAWLILAHS
ncbi:MAG: hypothetical protein K8L91_05195 [Anaerolineae bacterium]|nr:hypothetical protein [Anaerolineae bacterium]